MKILSSKFFWLVVILLIVVTYLLVDSAEQNCQLDYEVTETRNGQTESLAVLELVEICGEEK